MLKTRNQLLKKTELAVRARVPAKLKNGLERTLVAGLSLMYSKGGAGLMKEQFTKEGEPYALVAEGAAKLIGVLMHQSRNTMPSPIVTTAATLLALEGLDVMNKTQGVPIDNNLIAQTIQETGSSVLQLYGVTPEKLQQMAAEKQAGMQPKPSAGIIGSQAQQGAVQ